MLLGEIGPDLRALVEVFLDRPELRAKLAVCDLELLERLGTVRSSAFVYFEWFLRDAYGVKLLPAPAFTQGLIDRGLLSPRHGLIRAIVPGTAPCPDPTCPDRTWRGARHDAMSAPAMAGSAAEAAASIDA